MSYFIDPRSTKADEFAFLAAKARKAGQEKKACEFFARAAALEEEMALAVSEPKHERVRGVFAESAVAHWYQGRRPDMVQQVGARLLARGGLLSEHTIPIREMMNAPVLIEESTSGPGELK